ncbi:MAG: hypothetical protein R2788_21445 [Saprospiraceae bacterium]
MAVRHALGRHNVTPTLDFDQETKFSANKNFGLPFNVGSQADFEQKCRGKRGVGKAKVVAAAD